MVFGFRISPKNTDAGSAGFTVEKSNANLQKETVVAKELSTLKFKGDKSLKIYLSKECSGFNEVNYQNAVWFETKEEAEASGYRLSSSC